MPKARETDTVKVPVEKVVEYVRRRRAEGWRLDSKGKPQWSYTFKDNRVELTFSKSA